MSVSCSPNMEELVKNAVLNRISSLERELKDQKVLLDFLIKTPDAGSLLLRFKKATANLGI